MGFPPSGWRGWPGIGKRPASGFSRDDVGIPAGPEEQKDRSADQAETGSSLMWRYVAPNTEHRRLIPLTGFCEAEGEKGAKRRTWLSVQNQPIFAGLACGKAAQSGAPSIPVL
jgi:putative SOS response-associated peptidase YedK